jgi:hypothetical protein
MSRELLPVRPAHSVVSGTGLGDDAVGRGAAGGVGGAEQADCLIDPHTGSCRASCAWREVEGVVLAVTGAASLLTRTESWRPQTRHGPVTPRTCTSK